MPHIIAEKHRAVVSGDLRKTLTALAMPILALQMLNSCVGFTDVYLSGQISVSATVAVGLAAYVFWLVSMIFGLGNIGTLALVARLWGEEDYEQANQISNESMTFSIILGLVVTAIFLLFGPNFGNLLGMHDEQLVIYSRFIQLQAIAFLFLSVSLMGSTILRSVGDMMTPLYLFGTINIVNIVVSYVLVYGTGGLPKLGVYGIAVGTVVAEIIGGIFMFALLLIGRSGITLEFSKMRIRLANLRRLLRLSLPGTVDGMIMWTGHFVYIIIIKHIGNESFAAHMVGVELEALTYLPAFAWGSAAATMVGQSLGAKNPERAVQSGYAAMLSTTYITLFVALAFVFGAEQIYAIMHADPTVRRIGTPALQMIAIFEFPLAIMIVCQQSLRGAGDTWYPMWINIGGITLVRLPLAYLFAIVLDGGLIGAWLAMGIDLSIRGLLMWLRYQFGHWTATVV